MRKKMLGVMSEIWYDIWDEGGEIADVLGNTKNSESYLRNKKMYGYILGSRLPCV